MAQLAAPRARRGSVPPSAADRQRLGHADRVRIMEAARRLERATYRRGRGLHGGYLRQSGLRVLWFLLYRGLGRTGATDPSLGTIAEGLQIARSTVQVALGRIEEAGILTRVLRGLVRDRRWVQITNAYRFAVPDTWRSDTDLQEALDSLVKLIRWQGGEVIWEGSTAPAVSAEKLGGLLAAVGWGCANSGTAAQARERDR